jgi:hypothetical protein
MVGIKSVTFLMKIYNKQNFLELYNVALKTKILKSLFFVYLIYIAVFQFLTARALIILLITVVFSLLTPQNQLNSQV